MKYFITIATFIILMLVACRHHPGPGQEFESEGYILGQDMGMCMLCGGWFIEIDDTTYHFDNVPDESGIDLEHDTFPIHVRLNWSEGTIPSWIIIEDIIKI